MHLRFIVAAIAAGAVGSYFLVTRQPQGERHSSKVSAHAVGDGHSELPTSSPSSQTNASQLAALRPLKGSNFVPTPPAGSAVQRSPNATDDDSEQQKARMAQQVQAQFEADGEPTRESWQMRRTLQDAFRGFIGKGMSIEALECRFNLCRADLLFDDTETDVRIISDMFLHGTAPELHQYGGMMAPQRVRLPDGKVRTTLYMARQGDIEVFQ